MYLASAHRSTTSLAHLSSLLMRTRRNENPPNPTSALRYAVSLSPRDDDAALPPSEHLRKDRVLGYAPDVFKWSGVHGPILAVEVR